MRSLYSGVSGLINQQLKMGIIGNNIANINTSGYKAARLNFAEEVSQLLRGAQKTAAGASKNALLIGIGVKTGSIDHDFSQGILQSTGKVTDLGILGDGFFIVNDGTRGLYTRAGNFHFDGSDRLVDANGLLVQGWMADQTGDLSQSAALGNIVFNASAISPAKSTENVAIAGNLDAAAKPVIGVWTAGLSFTLAANGNPAIGTTDLNSLTQTTTPLVAGDVIDISGTNPDGTVVSATFTYGAANDGTTIDDLLASINGAYTGTTATFVNGIVVLTDANSGASSTTITLAENAANTGAITLPSFANSAVGFSPTEIASVIVYDSLGSAHRLDITFTKTDNPREWTFVVSFSGDETITAGNTGTLAFATDGTLETIIYDGGESTLIFDPQNTANSVSLTMDFANATGMSGLTQFAGPSTVNLPFQDGQANGSLTSFIINEGGKIIGSFSNGTNRLIAQIGLAKFSNPEGLINLGNNIYEVSVSSGVPFVGKAVEELSSAIVSGTLESSNVNLAAEFSEMIIAQRAFQASARTITVSDQFLQEVVQLKR